MRPAILLLVVTAVAPPLAAQEAGPHTDALLARVERGDIQARKDAETLAWQWIKLVAEKGQLDPASSRAMARTLLLLQEPLPPPDKGLSLEERPFRGATVHALQSALVQDSADAWSASQLERVAPYPFIWLTPDQELQTLRTLARRNTAVPFALQVTRIRLELEHGSSDSAADALDALPPTAVTPAARGHLAAEVAFAQRHDSTGAAAYYEGAAAVRDSADAAWYTRDLAWIATPAELAEWRALGPLAREPWLEKFWNRRDIEDGQLPGTRLPEQFRRWRIALRDFRWVNDASTAEGIIIPLSDGAECNGAPGECRDRIFLKDPRQSGLLYLNRMRPLTQVLDDRGGLILRHGEPAEIANLPGVNQLQEATNKWHTPNGPLIVSFSRMTDSLPNNRMVPSQRFGMVARNYPAGDMDATCHIDNRLCIPIDEARSGWLTQDYIRMRETAEHTDGNPETFINDLNATIQAYGIPNLGTLVVFAVPAKGLIGNARHVADTRSFTAHLRIVAGDSARGEFAAALDTTRSWALTSPANDSTQLTGFIVVPTPPGTWSVSVVLSDLARTAGTGERIGNVPVVAFDNTTFRIGDAILGSPSSGLTWTHDRTAIPLNPRNAWRPDEPAVLTYQLDGLIAGRAYETHIEIWDAGGSPKTFRNSIGFTSTATDTRPTLQRELSLRELPPGDYRVVLRVRDTVTGTEVTRERKLAVRK